MNMTIKQLNLSENLLGSNAYKLIRQNRSDLIIIE